MSSYDIAIIGMGCVFPEANNTKEYWENIISGKQFIKDMPDNLWHMDSFTSKEKNDYKSYTKVGSFIKDFEFNAFEYGIPPKNLQGVDRAQLVGIEATRQALVDAGIKPRSKELEDAITVIGGSGVDEYAHVCTYINRQKFFNKFKPHFDEMGLDKKQQEILFQEFTQAVQDRGHTWNPAVSTIGSVISSVPNRIAQVFGVKNFNMSVDGACGSSFVALSIACQALLAGDARIAIAGGVDLGINPPIYVGFSKLGGLSKDGIPNPFDKNANGLTIGEGGGVVVLKRLEDALADGDKIQAVIKGIGSSSDGAGQAIYNPSSKQRSIAMKKALETANIQAKDIQFLEAHATSTVVGDANEYDAISMVYGGDREGRAPLNLGTVKYQIGHLKAAAGVAGLIKTVLAMNNGKIPHMPDFKELTPHATRQSDSLFIPNTIQDWKPLENGSKYAAVTTSGFGGVNYHAIIEHAPKYTVAKREKVDRKMAIVGISCRVPGANDVDTFWKNISTGKNQFVDVDPVKMKWEENYRKGPESEQIKTDKIALIEDSKIDFMRHKISPKSVSQISPAQLLSVEIADNLLTDYGFDIKENKNIGISLGSMHDDNYADIFFPLNVDEYIAALRQTKTISKVNEKVLQNILEQVSKEIIADGPPHTEATLPGWMSNINAGIVANRLNCNGPNFTVDTACSSGLASFLPAMYQLMFTDTKMMIAGGLNRHTSSPFVTAVGTLGAMAKNMAAPFDVRGDGFLAGEGGVLYLLKRYADAKKDGDTIYGIIHNISGSSEYAQKNMVAPSEHALRHSIHQGLKDSGIAPEKIGIVDTHGSANKLSDILEAKALAAELRPNSSVPPVHITAIKSHIGHLYGGSGASSVLSVLQSLNARQVPGIRNLENIRPEITDILDKVQPQKGTVALNSRFTAGAVNSLGLGGANYFCVITLDEANNGNSDSLNGQKSTSNIDLTGVYTCNANSNDELLNQLQAALDNSNFASQNNTAKQICFSVSYENETVLKQKINQAILFLKSKKALKPLLTQGVYHNTNNKTNSKLAFCFPGQGTHYISMGKNLYDTNQGFKAIVDKVDTLAISRYKFELKKLIFSNVDDEKAIKQLSTLEGAQISLFAIELGVANVLEQMGIRPNVMLGHSFGEISALAAQGVWSLENAFEVVAARIDAAKLGSKSGKYKMLSIICTDEQKDALLEFAGNNVVLSNTNAPGQFILSGVEKDVLRTAEAAETLSYEPKILQIGSAFHSKFMEVAVEPFRKAIENLPCNPLHTPILSTITGKYISFKDNKELAMHLSMQLTTPINMPRDINQLYSDGVTEYLEIGPRWALSKMIEATLEGKDITAVPTLHPKVGDVETFRRALAYLVSINRIKGSSNTSEGGLLGDAAFMAYLENNEPAVLALLSEAFNRYNNAGNIPKSLVKPSITSKPALEKAVVAKPSVPVVKTSVQAKTLDITAWVKECTAVIAESTGYPAEMLGADLDLEADLGIDSVQRAEIWGSMVDKHKLDKEYRPEQIRSITELGTELAKLSGSYLEAPAAVSNTTETKGTLDIYTWVNECTAVIAESTGYPAEMLGADLDLEADLGIDSVQRAEIWGSMVDKHKLDKEYRPEQIRSITELATELAKLSGSYIQNTASASVKDNLGGTLDVSTWVNECTAVIAESTGYPAEMLGADLDLEADLGIDSVQRAEIWGSMVNTHGLDKEYRPEQIRTITELATELAKLSGSFTENTSVAANNTSSAGAQDIAVWVAECTNAIAESTGYPAEMLGADLDLEADLGIDSVQRAEIWGAMVNTHGLDKEYRPEQIRTITELAKELAQLAGPAEVAEPKVVSNAQGADILTWIAKCTSAIAESTGYPAEMLGADLDLEADLGIDSVQRAEIWGAMVNAHGLDKEYRPEQIRTITELANELANLSSGSRIASKADNVIAELSTTASVLNADEVNNYLFNCETKPLKAFDIKPFNCENILAIVDTTADKKAWQSKLKKLNKNTSIYTVSELLELDKKIIAEADTILVLFHQKLYKQSLSKLQSDLSKEVISLYNVFRKVSSVFAEKPGRIICPISQDGAFGNYRQLTNIMGSFPAGFIRSLQYEYPNVKFQLLDAGATDWEEVIAKAIDVVFPYVEAGYFEGKWVVPVMVKSEVQAKPNKVLLKDDLVLVTGGARGIVFECVFEVAKRTGCALLLTGRSELMDKTLPWMKTSPDQIDKVIREMEISLVKEKGMNLGEAKREAAKCKSQWEIYSNFSKLEANKIKYTYRKCDVSNKAELTALIKEFDKKEGIKGIVHGAGVQRSKLLNELADDAILMALNTKMEPLFVFAEQIDFSKLKLLSAFGSIAGLFGNAGQSDYALANDLLACSIAYLGQENKVFSQTIEWTAWAGIGMVTEAEEKRFAESGLNPLRVETGTKLYADAVLNTKLNRVAAFNKGAQLINSRQITIGAVEDYMIERLANEGSNEVVFSLEKDVYLHQHIVQGRTVVPGTFSTEIFAEVLEKQDKVVKNIKFRRPLWVREEGFTVEVLESDNKLLLLPKNRPAMEGKALENLTFALCETKALKDVKKPTIPKVSKTVIAELNKIAEENTAPFYSRLDAEFSGALKSGKIFRGVLSTLTNDDTLYSLLEFTDEAADLFALSGKFVINPVIADMAVQALASITMQAHNVMAIPYGIGEMQVFNQSTDKKIIIVCKNAKLSDDETKADVFAIEQSGKPLFYMKDMVLKAIAKSEQ